MIKLRDYQQKAVTSGVEFLHNKKSKGNKVIVIPTGGGKSLVIGNIAKQLDGDVIIFQPSKELLEQNFTKYIRYGGYASIFSASKGQKQTSNVTFATIGSVISKLSLFERYRYAIIDECHLVSPIDSSMYLKFFNETNVKCLGLTATPIRLKSYNFPERHSKLVMLDRMRPRFFNDYIHVTQINELEKQGFFAKTKYLNFDFDRSILSINSTGADFTEKSITEAFKKQDIYAQIIDCIKSSFNHAQKHILVFVPSISDAELLAKLPGISMVSGKTEKKEREQVLNKFKKGEIKVVANVGVLTTGFDFPELDTIIIARPTMSLALYYQMIGRGVRPHPSKKECLVIDLVGNYEKFGRVEDLVIEKKQGWGIYSGDRLITGIEMDLIEEQEQEEHGDSEDVLSINFGKYRGEKLDSILKKDPNYLKWLYENIEKKDYNLHIFDFIEKNCHYKKTETYV